MRTRTSFNQDTMHGPSYIENAQNYPWNEDTSFNQDTMHGPSYIENAQNYIPLKRGHLL